MKKVYIRKQYFNQIWETLSGKINLIQVIVGPRQVGKTTLALQIYDQFIGNKLYDTADQPNPPTTDWLIAKWQEARQLYLQDQKNNTLLIIDEVQKISRWSEVVKKLFDEDKRKRYKIRVILLGSSSLLMQQGLTESLAGRFELHRHYQWLYSECQEAFNLSLPEYIYFGGYPGALELRSNETRWSSFIRDSLIETVLAKDVLLLSAVTKPALLRQTFALAVSFPAQIMSYQKMLGNLHEAGNASTIASYLKLLSNAYLISPLEKYSGSVIRQKGSIPKLITLDNALVSAMSGQTFSQTKNNYQLWGRLVENSLGAIILKNVESRGGQLFYWRERSSEVDFIIKLGSKVIAIEVKSTENNIVIDGLKLFHKKYPQAECLIISDSKKQDINGIKNINIHDLFLQPELILK